MVTIRIPGMRNRIVAAKHTGDIQFFADYGSDAIDKESVTVLGAWSDNLINGETDSGGPPSRQQVMAGRTDNSLFGTDGWFEGEKLPNLNKVGQNAGIFRRRKRVMERKVPESSIE